MENQNLIVEKKPAKAPKGSFFKPVIQKKLSIGSSNDSYEVEADNMANKVMRMNDLSQQNISHTRALVQRKCAHCEEEEKIQMKPLADSISRLIQRSSNSENGGHVSSQIESQINSSKGGGNYLDQGTKNYMESRFGTDFSDVKIHTGSQAAQMNRELNAQAFTVGNDIYFNEGKYSPSSDSGKHLLAHELTHTVQQGGGIGRKLQKSPGSPAGGCGLCYGIPRNVGGAAHRIIQSAMVLQYPFIETEAPLIPFPRPSDENGFLDLLYINGNNIMIGEIKPANANGFRDGELDLLWYTEQIRLVMGNDMTVSRMELPQPLAPLIFPTLAPAGCPQFQELFVDPPLRGIYTYFCEPDYSVLIRECDCRNGRRVPQEVPVPHTVPRTSEERTRMQRVVEFVDELITTGEDLSTGIQRFLSQNRDLIDFILAAGIAALLAFFGKDIATAGAGIVSDVVLIPIVTMMMRIAWSMRALAN